MIADTNSSSYEARVKEDCTTRKVNQEKEVDKVLQNMESIHLKINNDCRIGGSRELPSWIEIGIISYHKQVLRDT